MIYSDHEGLFVVFMITKIVTFSLLWFVPIPLSVEEVELWVWCYPSCVEVIKVKFWFCAYPSKCRGDCDLGLWLSL